MNKLKKDTRKPKTPADPESPDILKPDDDIAEAEFEDRVMLYWEKHRKRIFLYLAIAAVVVVGSQTVRYAMERRSLGIQMDFREADTQAALIAFGEDQSGHPLAGLAYLKAANVSYAEEDFETARNLYGKAIELFKDDILKSGRARLGQAMATIMTGQEEDGLQALEAIAVNPGELDTTRAEASYKRAIIFMSQGATLKVKEELDRIEAMEKTGIWATKSGALREEIAIVEGLLPKSK